MIFGTCSQRPRFVKNQAPLPLAHKLRQQALSSPADREIAGHSGQQNTHVSAARLLQNGLYPAPVRSSPEGGLRGGKKLVQLIQIKSPIGSDKMDIEVVVLPSHRLYVGRLIRIHTPGYRAA